MFIFILNFIITVALDVNFLNEVRFSFSFLYIEKRKQFFLS